ncbi:hypothetical protein FHL15_002444 [Xylaria flabelliformis]|uniref:Uncharacterized protein n=1 Tax=Xylaria flabelliformis TaxID=2512241 RepID=A0A553I8N5_9PEZI|nr:hypothetical protein FHL15_002444 [Xylaria flabelliformis]
MNNSNLRKRRPHGREGAPAVPVAHDPSYPATSASVTPPENFSPNEINILAQAAAILNCSVSELYNLDSRGSSLSHLHHPISSYSISSKRPRLSTDLSAMPSHEKSPAVEQDISGHPEDEFTLSMGPTRLTQCLTSFSVCSPCGTCAPPGYTNIPAVSPYGYTERSYIDNKLPSSHSIPGTVSQAPPSLHSSNNPILAQQTFTGYTGLQPNRSMSTDQWVVQPTTSREGMVYPGPVPSQGYTVQPGMQSSSPVSPGNQTTSVPDFTPSSYEAQEEPKTQYSTHRPPSHAEVDGRRCETNPEDKAGTCLTCLRVSNVKVWRMPCLRYKITDVRLFKPGQVKGHEWTRRWVEGVPDDISHWASTETRKVKVTEGYTEYAIELRVRQFVPQDGDSLERSWVHNGIKKWVTIPAYAIVNLEEAKSAYSSYISRSLPECCKKILWGKDKLLGATYVMALKTARDPTTSENEKELLKKALQLWMAVRMTTKSTVIVGEETLGMSPDIMDETSPLQGKIPLPPVMGAQIELVLIHQIQSNLRREMLENLQSITQANKQHTWFTTYLITFILLHNVALLCQHDTGYARKHGMKTRFAREDMVREYQLGIYPFSAECKEQDLTTLAALNEAKSQFIRQTKAHIERHRKSWAKLRESHDYEDDFYYISQLYEENWMPQPTI